MKRIFLFTIFFASQALSAVFSPAEVHQLKKHFFANIHANGAIVASPSQRQPNYYYDWVRDSAIAMGLIETWYEKNHASQYKKRLLNYVSWTKTIQHQLDTLPGYDILGEPKFYIDGRSFDGPWGRPQNDGPALRASVLMRFAQQLLKQGKTAYVTTNLYHGGLDPQTMGTIKMDLEYTAHHWHEANFDLWEEVFGHHFFTAMAQQKALRDGAAFARQLEDDEAANFYELQANLLIHRLKQHIDHENTLIQATLPPHASPQKFHELDSAIILGVLINPQSDDLFSPHHTHVQNTVKALHKEFYLSYPINTADKGALLFGRYPGDTYDGYQTDSIGNPWFILTATMAEYYYTLANTLPETQENKSLRRRYIETGDEYLQLIKRYAPDMYLSEQINLNTGIQQGAISLTWSYVSVLRAITLRDDLKPKA